jgi:hypothetical protein
LAGIFSQCQGVHAILPRAVSGMLNGELVPQRANRGTQEIRNKTSIKKLSLELTIEELEVLLPLASDQLFRNEFIDIRIPGFERNREKIQSAKAVISRIKERLHLAQHESSATVRFSCTSLNLI